MLFDSGLCQKCDAQAKRGTAAAGGLRRRSHRSPADPANSESITACGRYVKGPERGICATCSATRAAHLSKPKQSRSRVENNGRFDVDRLSELRDRYARELEEAELLVANLRVKVEVSNEFLSELQRK